MTDNPNLSIVQAWLGIEGHFRVGVIKDMDGRRFVVVRRANSNNAVGDDELRARVLERVLLDTHPLFKDIE